VSLISITLAGCCRNTLQHPVNLSQMHTITRSATLVATLGTFAFGTIALNSPLLGSASAHSIIQLNEVSAVAGQTSAMTLEIQHGCLPAEPTLQVEAFVGAPWRAVKPKPVAGWTSSVTKQAKGGWHITWVNQGTPIPFGTATFFPITVSWPKNPGTYGMSVMQLCPGSSYYWNDKYAPATASTPSPPLTPRAEVLVVAKKDTSGKTTATSTGKPAAPVHAH
jgi:uncharacterized protein YcnI